MLRKSLKVPDQTMGVISIHKILSHLRYTAKIGLWQIFRLSIFVLSQEKCPDQSHWAGNYRFFFSYSGFLPLLGNFKCHCLQAIRIFQCFSSHNPTATFLQQDCLTSRTVIHPCYSCISKLWYCLSKFCMICFITDLTTNVLGDKESCF